MAVHIQSCTYYVTSDQPKLLLGYMNKFTNN